VNAQTRGGPECAPELSLTPKISNVLRRELKRFNSQLHDGMTQLQAQFGRLGETWRD